jgi:spore coat polysaccharide biosynthesis protein SpsF
MEIRYRNVKFEDASLLYKWRNSFLAKKNSINTNLIEFDDHLKWFSKRILEINNQPFWIFFLNNEPIGTIRFDLETNKSNTFNISIYVDPIYHGQGFGSQILDLSLKLLPNNTEILLVAKVKISNLVSKKLFLRSGFAIVAEFKNLVVLEKLLNNTL